MYNYYIIIIYNAFYIYFIDSAQNKLTNYFCFSENWYIYFEKSLTIFTNQLINNTSELMTLSINIFMQDKFEI